MPAVYRLAALHLLGDEKRATEAFKKARDLIADGPKDGRDLNGEQSIQERKRGWLQSGLFNLLEFAAFVTKQKYGSLEGLKSPFDDVFLKSSHWFLVGPDPSLSKVRLPREFALRELRSLGKKHPNAVFFQLGDN